MRVPGSPGDARPWTYAALFGALWGALELTLGTTLHLAQLPAGQVLGVLGLLCLVTLRRLQPRVGVCLLAGAVAVFLKVFAVGGLRLGPLVGIGAEAVLVEVAFMIGRTTVVAAVAGGAVVLVFSAVMKVVVVWLVAGREALRGYLEAVRVVLEPFELDGVSWTAVLAAILVAHAALGAAAGLWAWIVAGRVVRRLGRRS
jgi:hypothetical protein